MIMGKKVFYPIFRAAMCTFEGDGINILGKHYELFNLPGNKPVFDAAAKAPDRLCAYVLVNPKLQSEEEMRAEVEKYVGEETFCGIKVHPFYGQYEVSLLDPVCRILEPYGKPLLIHLPFDCKDDILALVDKYPKVNFILAHCAFPYFDMIWPELVGRKNVYVDISSGAYIDGRMAGRALKAFGPDRLLYGTDGPFGFLDSSGEFDMRAEYEFATKRIPADALDAVSGENFMKLWRG